MSLMDFPLQVGHSETLELQLLQILCQLSYVVVDDVIYFGIQDTPVPSRFQHRHSLRRTSSGF